MTLQRRSLSKIWNCTDGTALIEMTIVFPVVFLLMIGAVDFGRALSDHATLGKGVRGAGRYLASLPSSIFSTGCPNWALQNATDLVVYGKFPADAQTDKPLLAGWAATPPDGSAANNVTITCSSSSVGVSAKAPYNALMLPSLFSAAATLTLSAAHNEDVVND